MKRRITLSIALALGVVLLSLMSSDSTAKAQEGGRRFVADTGIIPLGRNQVLRVAIDFDNDGDVDGSDFIRVRFSRMEYIEQGNIYRIGSQSTSAPVTLARGEAALTDILDGTSNTVIGVRAVVLGNFIGNSRNVRATATIINTLTGKVTSHIIMANTEGDFH
jgi:hypothetical protein